MLPGVAGVDGVLWHDRMQCMDKMGSGHSPGHTPPDSTINELENTIGCFWMSILICVRFCILHSYYAVYLDNAIH